MQGIILCPYFLSVVVNEHNKKSSKHKEKCHFQNTGTCRSHGQCVKKAELVICVFKQSNSKTVDWNLMCWWSYLLLKIYELQKD